MSTPGPGEAASSRVREAAGRDPLAADLRCSLFAAALQSYKRDSALRPFPGRYASGETKDFEGLVSGGDRGPGVLEPDRGSLCCPSEGEKSLLKGEMVGEPRPRLAPEGSAAAPQSWE